LTSESGQVPFCAEGNAEDVEVTMAHYLFEGRKVRLLCMLQAGDTKVHIWGIDGPQWVGREQLLVVDDIAQPGVSISLRKARSCRENEITGCTCCDELVWDARLLDSRGRCPLNSVFGQAAWDIAAHAGLPPAEYFLTA
jgi:hypothetical protein